MEEKFEIINLQGRTGILMKIGQREVVVSIKMLPGADQADNEWLAEEIRALYIRYYCRTRDYSK